MRGLFSIEWLAQSSKTAGTDSPTDPTRTLTGLSTSGTHSESLPGFYCRHNQENRPGQSPGLPCSTEVYMGVFHSQNAHSIQSQQGKPA